MPDAAVRLSAIPQRAVVRLKSFSLTSASTIPCPWEGERGSNTRVLALAPGEWWIVSDGLTGAQLREQLRAHLDGRDIAIVDLSCALKGLRIEGPAARELLAKGCGLDLHPRYFPPGLATRTRFAQVGVTLACVDPSPRFELYVEGSCFAWLRSWVDDAAIEFQQPTG